MGRSWFRGLAGVSAVLWVATGFEASGAEPAEGPQAAAPAGRRPNVLFIAVDDLNHWVGHLGRNRQTRTPNIDRLAELGVTFTRAYCAAPVCNPSRTAILCGRRPSTTGVYENGTDWRPIVPTEQTLLHQFRQAGYFVGGAGKIFHGNFERRSEWDDYLDRKGEGADPRPVSKEPAGPDLGVGAIKFAPLDCRDEDLADWRITDWVIDQLKKRHDRPFFLACGLHKPHMPWNVPRRYYEMFPLATIERPPILDGDLEDLPSAGVRMARPEGDHASMLRSGRWNEAIQAYLATIAYTDMNVGRLLDALDASPHRDNTIVVLWGDHGWHLGEKQHWRKFALWEEATRAPLIWVVPGKTRAGTRCERTVDFMSLYPTVTELCGIATPAHVEGTSIAKLLEDPAAPWDRPAVTTHFVRNHAVRTERWRYIRYQDGGEELYDEVNDPYEWKNLANDPRTASIRKELAAHLPTVNVPDPRPDRQGNARPENSKPKAKRKAAKESP